MQTHVHWVGDTIQPSHPLLPPFPLALNLSQHQGQVAKFTLHLWGHGVQIPGDPRLVTWEDKSGLYDVKVPHTHLSVTPSPISNKGSGCEVGRETGMILHQISHFFFNSLHSVKLLHGEENEWVSQVSLSMWRFLFLSARGYKWKQTGDHRSRDPWRQPARVLFM